MFEGFATRRRFLQCGTATLALAAGKVYAQETRQGRGRRTRAFQVTVTEDAGKNVPVSAVLEVPERMRSRVNNASVTLVEEGTRKEVPGQIVVDGNEATLHWILPEAPAGSTRWMARFLEGPAEGAAFSLADTAGEHLDVLFDGRPVLRYMYAFDPSTKERFSETYKPFCHVFDETGKDFITKGAGGHDTHHRGIFIGWTKFMAGEQRYDMWSMSDGSAQVHRRFTAQVSGPVLARFTSEIEWRDPAGKVLVSELRTMTCYRQPAGADLAMIDFNSVLKAEVSDIVLDGNAEHGGVQFRAHNDVAEAAGAGKGNQKADTAPEEMRTDYEFPRDGIATGEQNLNENQDLPWAAMSYALRGKRYGVQHMNHPGNPKNTLYSAYRPYGRFGAFFVAPLEVGKPMTLRYRFHVVEGPLPSREAMNEAYAGYAELAKAATADA